jgi:hypothetical protein
MVLISCVLNYSSGPPFFLLDSSELCPISVSSYYEGPSQSQEDTVGSQWAPQPRDQMSFHSLSSLWPLDRVNMPTKQPTLL